MTGKPRTQVPFSGTLSGIREETGPRSHGSGTEELKWGRRAIKADRERPAGNQVSERQPGASPPQAGLGAGHPGSPPRAADRRA